MRIMWLLALASSVLAGCSSAATPTDSSSSMEAVAIADPIPDAPTTACLKTSNKTCAADKALFEAAWPKAWAGDHAAQRRLAYMQSVETAGVQHSDVQGCAWGIILAVSKDKAYNLTDTFNYNSACAFLSSAEWAAASKSARTYYTAINGTNMPPAPMPQD